MKTIWNKKTGEAHEYESVDAREILEQSPDLYTDEPPEGYEPNDSDGDGLEGAPQNVASVENEFRREPVGDDPPAKDRDETIIRNPVTDTARMAPPADGDPLDHDHNGKKGGSVDLDSMTVPELKAHAEKFNIDLGDATRKDDIRAAIDKA
jgi:hypothetical protein